MIDIATLGPLDKAARAFLRYGHPEEIMPDGSLSAAAEAEWRNRSWFWRLSVRDQLEDATVAPDWLDFSEFEL